MIPPVVFALAPLGRSLHTSTGSRTARSISSIPRFWNLAILASVPASTMVLVMTLWAWRLYKGMMVRRVEVTEVVEEKEAVEPYEEVSERLEAVRVRETEVPPSLLSSRDCRGPRVAGGTSWTWRLSGWFDFAGGGRTTMKVSLTVFVLPFFALVSSSAGWVLYASSSAALSVGSGGWARLLLLRMLLRGREGRNDAMDENMVLVVGVEDKPAKIKGLGCYSHNQALEISAVI
ncbi:hypothetical protein FPV67DRAFT_1504449 [Lyophyllum atratum]|nr:hypothetical protein FPV67DRAFT_1504449 [Lyophyllum atratum]